MDKPQQSLFPTTFPLSILMGFVFYGAGNIGDDLMVAGFTNALSQLKPDSQPKLYSTSAFDVPSQKKRFPQIFWRHRDENYIYNPNLIEYWAGVGDTPFQLTCGTWFLDLLLSDIESIKKFRRRVLVGIGAETEIQPKIREFSLIAKIFDRIYARDEHSKRILVEGLGVKDDCIFAGSDLANISLPNILENKHAEKKFKLGLIVAGDTLTKTDISEIEKFIAVQDEPLAFVAGETRMGNSCERFIFRKFTRFPWSKVRGKAILQVPDYHNGSLYELIQPIVECETILSTRYHGLLAAAWAGCKVAAIARSSKVTALAEVLGIPFCIPPLTRAKLEFLQKEASIVSIPLLNGLKDQAINGVKFALGCS